jgi:Cytochrome c554 and c-prime
VTLLNRLGGISRWSLIAVFCAMSLAACSVVHITTPFFSTIKPPVLPTPTDHKFLDLVLELTKDTQTSVDVSGEVARVRDEMLSLTEDRYWAAEQLLVHDEIRDQVLEALVTTDNEFQSPFISAKVCGTCHPMQFDQWSVSPHAYAQMSPVFNSFHGATVLLTNGTNGDFCIRCHTPIGMNLREPAFMANELRNIASREGITCVVCHRIEFDFGKISGRLAFVEGNIFEPIYGPSNDVILKETIERRGLQNAEDAPAGQKVHGSVITMDPMTQPGFCGQCHDVTLGNTFRLEEAFSEWKHSDAASQGISCQDCHMGKIPGENGGYDTGPGAVIAGEPTTPRRITNHIMAGPEYSIIHPGLFPHLPPAYGNPDNQIETPFFAELTPGRFKVVAGEYVPIPLWLEFDHYGDWGKEEYESELEAIVYELEDLSFELEDAEGAEDAELVADLRAQIAAKMAEFPDFKSWGGTPGELFEVAEWFESGKNLRTQARRILEQRQYRLLSEYREQQTAVLRAGYIIENIEVERFGGDGMDFTVTVRNPMNGHNAPTGFDAERSVFLQVHVTDANGKDVFVSGDLDPNGDPRDLHSVYAHSGAIGSKDPLWHLPEPGNWEPGEPTTIDPFLFSLQSKFIVRLNRGGEREQVLPINYSADPVPFIRPPTRSNILHGQPAGQRVQRRGLPPETSIDASYSVTSDDLAGSVGPYTVRIRLMAGMVPVNLVEQIRAVGFDYGMSPWDVAKGIVDGYEAEVFLPTTIGPAGLVEADPEQGSEMRPMGGRINLWEYEITTEGGGAPVRILPPPDEPK